MHDALPSVLINWDWAAIGWRHRCHQHHGSRRGYRPTPLKLAASSIYIHITAERLHCVTIDSAETIKASAYCCSTSRGTLFWVDPQESRHVWDYYIFASRKEFFILKLISRSTLCRTNVYGGSSLSKHQSRRSVQYDLVSSLTGDMLVLPDECHRWSRLRHIALQLIFCQDGYCYCVALLKSGNARSNSSHIQICSCNRFLSNMLPHSTKEGEGIVPSWWSKYQSKVMSCQQRWLLLCADLMQSSGKTWFFFAGAAGKRNSRSGPYWGGRSRTVHLGTHWAGVPCSRKHPSHIR